MHIICPSMPIHAQQTSFSGAPQTNVQGHRAYLGGAVVARGFLAPRRIDHFGAPPLPLSPIPLMLKVGALKHTTLNPTMRSAECRQFPQWGLEQRPSRKRFCCISGPTPCPEKRGHVIFNYNSRIPWSIFIIFIPLETWMNTPQLHVIYLLKIFMSW